MPHVFTEEARMNPQERQLVDELFERLAKLENAPRDAEAQDAIAQGLSRAPNAVYALVQTALVQDEALKRAAARIEELEAHTAGPQEQQGSFLDNMRGAIFGQQQKGGSVPSVRPAEQARPVWNTGGAYQNAPAPMAQQPDPRAPQAGGFGGGSFLGTAAASAAGMIGGSLLMNSIGGLMGGGHRQGFGQGFGDTSSAGRGDSGSPWSGDQSKGDLAREAGVNDIGRSGDRDADADGRQAFADHASNDHDDDNEDYDSDDDYDSGDSDTA
jgi:hypothetical protein